MSEIGPEPERQAEFTPPTDAEEPQKALRIDRAKLRDRQRTQALIEKLQQQEAAHFEQFLDTLKNRHKNRQ